MVQSLVECTQPYAERAGLHLEIDAMDWLIFLIGASLICTILALLPVIVLWAVESFFGDAPP